MGSSNHYQHSSAQKVSGSKKAARTPHKRTPAEVITYRLDSEMVYVDPANSMEEALDYAQNVFPQLADVSRSRIAFSVNVRVGANLRSVRIASMAWRRVMTSLATYEIIDISILPAALECASKSESALEDIPPPKYNGDASSSTPSLLGPDLYSSGVFLGCEKSPLVIRNSSPMARRRGVFAWLLRRS